MAQIDSSTPVTHCARYVGKDSHMCTVESLYVFWWSLDNGIRSPNLLISPWGLKHASWDGILDRPLDGSMVQRSDRPWG